MCNSYSPCHPFATRSYFPRPKLPCTGKCERCHALPGTAQQPVPRRQLAGKPYGAAHRHLAARAAGAIASNARRARINPNHSSRVFAHSLYPLRRYAGKPADRARTIFYYFKPYSLGKRSGQLYPVGHAARGHVQAHRASRGAPP